MSKSLHSRGCFCFRCINAAALAKSAVSEKKETAIQAFAAAAIRCANSGKMKAANSYLNCFYILAKRKAQDE